MNTEKVFHLLSESQKSIWYLEKAYPGTSLNIVAGNLRLKGEVCYPALEKALNIFVKKNDSMRLRINEKDGVAMQYVSDYKEFKVDFIDFSKGGGLKDLFLWDEGMTKTPFNIIENELYYCALYKASDDEGGIYVKMHQLISDTWTLGLASWQVIDLYTKIKNGQPVDESPNRSYIEHVMNEAAYKKSSRFENDKDYWNRKFKTLPEMTVLKPSKSADKSISARRKTLITPLKLSSKIREFCKENNVSVFTLFMSALALYMNRVTRIEDIVLGATILNRTDTWDNETTGMFANGAVPFRIAINDAMDFRTFAKDILTESKDILQHQKYPRNDVNKDLDTLEYSNRLFEVVLNYQNLKLHKNETDIEYTTKRIFSGCQLESLIISVNDREDGGSLIIDYDFLTDVYDIKEIEFLHQHVISLLWHALDNPAKRISKLEMMSEKDKRRILHEFNNTYAEYPTEKTINQMFEAQADRTPDNIALMLNGRKMTYAELNNKSNMLARTLRDKGVGPDKIVGIAAGRSFELVIGIMAILKAGGAYLAIDPDCPADHKRYMLENSRAEIILTQHDLQSTAAYGGEVIDIDDVGSYIGDGRNLPVLNSSGDLAYIMYSSDSSGGSNGVMVEHTGVVNSFCWGVKEFCLNGDSVILQKTAPTFDPSVWEILWWLMLGGAVCLLDSGDEKDPEAIIAAVERYNVSVLYFTPAMMGSFLNYVESTSAAARLSSLRYVFSYGEAINISIVEHFNRLLNVANGTKLYSLYGHTETTVEVSSLDCSAGAPLETIPIGKRIDNFHIYILDKNKNFLPIGVPGEMFVSGAGLARGYLNNPELTAERFIDNPFVHGEKMFRTGDRGRWYPLGDIEYLGRMDTQIKINERCIAIGEIESRLLSHEFILEAVVKPFKDAGGDDDIAAFIVTNHIIGADEIRDYLLEVLPDYMIPGCFVFIDEMPLNSSGKKDRDALPRLVSGTTAKPGNNPTSNETPSGFCGILRKIKAYRNKKKPNRQPLLDK